MFGRLSVFRRRRASRLRLERLEDRATPATFTPSQIRHAYGFDQIAAVNGTALTGAGQTIALIEAYYDSTIASDLATFDSNYGIPAPPTFTQVNQTGGDPSSLHTDRGWSGETALDVEWAHAIAPGANILLVEAASSGSTDLNAAVDYARKLAGVSVVSMSWGSTEFSGETAGSSNAHFQTPAGHAGVSFFASSGDQGGVVNYPAVSPNVVAVGGTSLTLSGGNYGSESAWSGGGGGASAFFTKPSWQTAYSGTMRGTPDVSYDANPNTGVSVYDSAGGGWYTVGGTSAAAPQWAALVALADQGRALVGFGTFDGQTQLLPALYKLPATDFHDITSGSNGFSATAGYDLATGLGTPKAQLVVGDLVAYGATAPSVTGQPSNQSASAGQLVTFTATASGSPAPTVQWQVSTDGGATFSDIAGATSTTYSFTATSADNGHLFRAVFTNIAGSATSSAATVTVAAATPPVSVASVVVNDGSAQRSEVRSITVTFSGHVNFLFGDAGAAVAFHLLHVQTGLYVNLNSVVSLDAQGRTVVTLYFFGNETDPVSALNGGLASLADGRYTLTIDGTMVTGDNGAALDGNGDGTAGGNYVSGADTFGGSGPHLYRLFGDVNGDGVVDTLDLGQFRSAFNSGSGGATYLSFLDADNSGTIDAADLGQLRTRFNLSVF